MELEDSSGNAYALLAGTHQRREGEAVVYSATRVRVERGLGKPETYGICVMYVVDAKLRPAVELPLHSSACTGSVRSDSATVYVQGLISYATWVLRRSASLRKGKRSSLIRATAPSGPALLLQGTADIKHRIRTVLYNICFVRPRQEHKSALLINDGSLVPCCQSLES